MSVLRRLRAYRIPVRMWGLVPVALNSQSRFKNADAVAGDWDLSALGIFERDNDLAGEPGIHFVDPIDVDQGRAVDSQEAGSVQAALQFRYGQVNIVPMAVDHCISELVVGYEVSYRVEVEE